MVIDMRCDTTFAACAPAFSGIVSAHGGEKADNAAWHITHHALLPRDGKNAQHLWLADGDDIWRRRRMALSPGRVAPVDSVTLPACARYYITSLRTLTAAASAGSSFHARRRTLSAAHLAYPPRYLRHSSAHAPVPSTWSASDVNKYYARARAGRRWLNVICQTTILLTGRSSVLLSSACLLRPFLSLGDERTDTLQLPSISW